jgi:HK97 family phage major capsid protein
MTNVRVTEPSAYSRNAPHSYFADLAFSRLERASTAVEDRLKRHDVEMRTYRVKRASELAAAERRMADEGIVFEKRVNPNPTAGFGGNFDPPAWLIEDFAVRRRPERVLADLARQFPLPTGAQTVNVPILSTGTAAAQQQPLEADSDQDIIDAATSSPVCTVSGAADASLQLLEQSPRNASFDSLMFEDLMNAADADLEQMMTTGTGTGGTFTGVTNVAGITTVTYTDATPTGSEMYQSIAQAGAQLADARFLRPDAFLMRFARWSWLAASEDTSHRPFSPPGDRFVTLGSNPNGPTPIGSIVGVPVVTSESLPATLSGNQDLVLAVRSSDFLLFEGDPNLAVMTEVLSGTLGVRIQLRKYVAAIVGRYPTGIAQVTGSGMAVESGW